MRGPSAKKRGENTLRRMLTAWKNDYLLEEGEFGSYPEKVREALDGEIAKHPEKWNVAARGREAIVGLFMAGVWRSDEAGSEDEDQLSFFFVESERLPVDITYRDQTAGKYKMRTVSTQAATIDQWMRAVELQEEKQAQAERRIGRNKAIGAALLARARGDVTARIVDCIDLPDVA